jgi:hypothetical protein
MKNILIIFFLFSCALITNAQKINYTYYVVPPIELQVKGSDMDGMAESYTELSNGEKLYWSIIYSTKTKKFFNFNFALPEGMTQVAFENSVNAMTIGEFWNGAVSCLYQQANQVTTCITSLMRQAVADCRNPANDANLHCWTNP